jgi:hypothetical protein
MWKGLTQANTLANDATKITAFVSDWKKKKTLNKIDSRTFSGPGGENEVRRQGVRKLKWERT